MSFMAFVRMIFPAWISGFYSALLIVLLIFFLNPVLHLDPAVFFRFLPLAAIVSVPAALLWPVLYRFLRLFARRRLRVRWYSFKYLSGFAAVDLVLVSVLYWFNGNLLSALIPPEVSVRLRAGSFAVSGVALLFVTVLFIPRLRRNRGMQMSCYLLAAFLPVSLAILRTGYRPPPKPSKMAGQAPLFATSPRLLVLGIEGATLDEILPLVSQGKLPWFARLLKRGSRGRLSSFRPCVSAVIWESLLTGKLPYKHQILDSSRYLLPGGKGEVRVVPRGFGFRRLVSLSGMKERFQDTSQAEALDFSQILEGLGLQVRQTGSGEETHDPPGEGSRDRLDRFLDPEVSTPPGTEGLVDSLRRAFSRDRSTAAAGLKVWGEGRERVVIVILPGLDRVSHLFLRYAMPAGFGNVPPDEVEKYGPVLERYYRYLDELLGKFLKQAELPEERSPGLAESLVLVVSPHGIEPLPFLRRLLEGLEGNRFESGYHGRAPDGLILASGGGVRHGALIGKTSILDLVPTLLYRFGLPIGMDMDGRPLTSLFDDAFVSDTPVLLIPSYEARRAGREGAASQVSP